MKKKPKQHPRANYADWHTKEATASALNVSTKTVERLAADGEIQSAMYKRPEGGARIKVFHPADVERLRKKLLPDAAPFIVPAEADTKALARPAAATANTRPAQDWERSLAVQIAKAGQLFLEAEHHPPNVPVTEVLFLTLDQAVRLSGLPRSVIKQMPAIRTGRGWRIRRQDLEALTTDDARHLADLALSIRWYHSRPRDQAEREHKKATPPEPAQEPAAERNEPASRQWIEPPEPIRA
jgi:hypothetical protein